MVSVAVTAVVPVMLTGEVVPKLRVGAEAAPLGLDVTDSLQLRHADGTPDARLWALGPIVRGVFWECIAVPDIRVQASHVAVSVVARLREDAPRWSFII